MDLATLEKRLDKVIGRDMREDTPGMSLLITKGEDILIRKSYGLADIEAGKKIKCDDAFVIASNTKQFTCAAIMMLKEQGLVDYDEPVERFFPDFPDYVKYVTVRDLMTHVSGIKEYFEDNVWLDIPDSATADTARMLEIIKEFGGLTFEPRTQYSYCNSAYVMLGAIVEQLSGMKFGEFLKARIFEPLGMKDTIAPDYFDVRAERLTEGYAKDEGGNFVRQEYNMALVGYADGNMQSTADDLFIWHKYLYMSNSELLMKRDTLAEAFKDNYLTDGSATGYGFGFFLGEYKGHREIWHTGGTTGFISRASRFPDDDISLIMLTNYEGLPKNEMYERIAAEIFQV